MTCRWRRASGAWMRVAGVALLGFRRVGPVALYLTSHIAPLPLSSCKRSVFGAFVVPTKAGVQSTLVQEYCTIKEDLLLDFAVGELFTSKDIANS